MINELFETFSRRRMVSILILFLVHPPFSKAITPLIDESATDRQQQALGILAPRIVFQTGEISYVVHEDETNLFVNGVRVLENAHSADIGILSVERGDTITADRPVAVYQESGYPVPSIAHAGYRFLTASHRGTTQRYTVYAPFGPAILKYASEETIAGQSIGKHVDWENNQGTKGWRSKQLPEKSIETIDITTSDNKGYFHIFYSDAPILMIRQNTENEDFAWVPRAGVGVIGARSAALYASFSADPVRGVKGSQEGARYLTSDSPVGGFTARDGFGDDADHYVPINALGDTYYIHHPITGFQIVAIEPATINVDYWNGNDWIRFASYDHEDATLAGMGGERFVGSVSGEGPLIESGQAPWRFVGSGRFYLRTNDADGDEYPVLGYWSALRVYDADGDGVEDSLDAFPNDPAASIDTDGDGLPDDWNEGKSQADSTSDPALALDNDDDNDGVDDQIDGFPLISLDGREDSDADGYPDDCDESCGMTGMIADIDDDNDGIFDNSDNCPLVANSDQTNSDVDAEGDDCDYDDDNDGVSDEQELRDGTDPFNAFSCLGCYSVVDLDADGQVKALTDGLIFIRYLFGFTGESLTVGAIGSGAERDTPEEIKEYLDRLVGP